MKQSIFYLSLLIVSIFLIATSCAYKPVEIDGTEAIEPKVCSGMFLRANRFSPIYFNINSLTSKCNFPYDLEELIASDNLNPLRSSFTNEPMVTNESNWDLVINLVGPGSNFKLEWLKKPLTQQSFEFKTTPESWIHSSFTQFLRGNKYQIAENQELTLLFYISGLGASSYINVFWEYVELP